MIASLGNSCHRFIGRFNYRIIVRHVYLNYLKTKQTNTFPKEFCIWSSNVIVTRFLVPLVSCNSDVKVNEQHHVYLVHPQNFFQTILVYVSMTWDSFETFLRGVQLMCIFTPMIVLFPITFMGSHFKSIWYKMLLTGIEFSGPVIVKLGQWASTRQDLFSKEFCLYLAKLQHDMKPHPWYYTKKCLEIAYGSQWQDIFLHIENNRQPIGSGCCAQVYKAWIKEEQILSRYSTKIQSNRISKLTGDKPLCLPDGVIPVAVKVRHPNMEKRLRQDINILKFLTVSITLLIPNLKWLSLPECVDDFSQMMKGQVNFYVEAHNLNSFSRNFKDFKYIKFPSPVWPLTRSNILVETFERGQQVDDFANAGKSFALKKHLAEMGVNTILKMVFIDNFIHGDLHPGNMLVEEKETLQDSVTFPWRKSTKESLTLVLLDCGIVSSLAEKGKKCLKDVFSAVVRADGERVAELFLEHSNHECRDVESFKSEIKDIVKKALSKTVSLQQVDVSVLMNSVFSTMIRHRVKVESSFSSVILSIMVLEGFGRTLDPTIDVVEKAKPFLFNDSVKDDFILIFQ